MIIWKNWLIICIVASRHAKFNFWMKCRHIFYNRTVTITRGNYVITLFVYELFKRRFNLVFRNIVLSDTIYFVAKNRNNMILCLYKIFCIRSYFIAYKNKSNFQAFFFGSSQNMNSKRKQTYYSRSNCAQNIFFYHFYIHNFPHLMFSAGLFFVFS